jgi:hypothetical protein
MGVGNLVLLSTLALLWVGRTEASVHKYIEDFATTQYKDALNTTVSWDTVAGEIRLPPFELTLAGSYGTAVNAAGVAIAGNYAFVADDAAGLLVVDISDPSNPLLAGSYNTPNSARDVAIAGDYAYVADFESGLQVLDISSPTSPSFVGSRRSRVPGKRG